MSLKVLMRYFPWTEQSVGALPLMQMGAGGWLEVCTSPAKEGASPKEILLGKKIEGNMMVMPPPAGMAEAARKERVAVLRAALGKRSLAAIVKVTLDICRGAAGGAAAEEPEGVPVAGGRSWAWVPEISRMAAKQMVAGITLTHTML